MCGHPVDQQALAGQAAAARDTTGQTLPPAASSGTATTLPTRSQRATPAVLPLAASLIGREELLATLLASLKTGVTSSIVGPEGVGKTALAAKVAARLASEEQAFPGGIAWIPCEGLTGESGLAELWTSVAHALHLEQVLAQPSSQKRRATLPAALLQREPTLLVLDTIEPGLDADAAVETLARHKHTTLLLTARQRIPSRQLVAFDLAPLKPADARALYLKRLDQAEASLLPEEETALASLLESLGHLPLAIELTAAYAGLQLLGVAQLDQEARGDGPDALPLHDSRTALLKCLERSWTALPPRVQHLFASLSLLEGASFPRAAALALTEELNDDADGPEVENASMGDLATVISYALVQVLPGGDRLRLHPLLREFASQKLKTLPTPLQARLGNAMAVYWLAYASAHPGSEGMDALEAEASGLMGAVTWAQTQGKHRMVLHLTHALRHTWDVRGRHDEERRLYTWASESAQKLGDLQEQRWAIHQLGVIQHRLGQWKEAQASYERALTLAWQIGDLMGERDEVYALALLDKQKGKLSAARVGHEQALQLARQSGDLAAEWESVHTLALLDSQAGRVAEARANYEQALALARQLGEPSTEAIALGNFGLFLHKHGEREQGRRLIYESLEMSRQLNHTYEMGKCYQFLAWLASDEGNRSSALTHYRGALRCFEQVGSPEAKHVRADLRRLEAEMAVERPFTPEIVRVVRAFLNDNNSWDETRALLEDQQALLFTDEAEQFLSALIEQVQRDETPTSQDRADYFAAHLLLLRDARASDIPAAWERFQQSLLLDEQEEEDQSASPVEGLTQEEAEQAAQNASFLAKKFGLRLDDPQLPALQQHLRDFLSEQQETI